MPNNVQSPGRNGGVGVSPAEGFTGWTPEDALEKYTLRGAATSAQYKGPWVTGVALAVGDVVQSGTKVWRVKAAIAGAANTVAPAENVTFTDVDLAVSRRGRVEPTGPNVEIARLFR